MSNPHKSQPGNRGGEDIGNREDGEERKSPMRIKYFLPFLSEYLPIRGIIMTRERAKSEKISPIPIPVTPDYRHSRGGEEQQSQAQASRQRRR